MPWNRARKLRYQIQEERLNSLPGGQKGINSGRLRPFKRDGRIYDFLIETRINQKPGAKTATISKQEFQELRRQALGQPGGMKPGKQINKTHGAQTRSISKQELQELRRQALGQPGGMKPGMQITIDDLDLMVVDLADFTDMYNYLVELSARES